MQNWKIKRMSYKRINEWLEEINHLLDYYQRKKKLDVCGLCPIVVNNCDACLWKVMENSHCCNLKKKLGYSSNIINARNRKKWREARIPMLRRWKKILQAEKDNRTCGGG